MTKYDLINKILSLLVGLILGTILGCIAGSLLVNGHVLLCLALITSATSVTLILDKLVS